MEQVVGFQKPAKLEAVFEAAGTPLSISPIMRPHIPRTSLSKQAISKKNLSYDSIVSAVVIKSLSAHQKVLAAAAIQLITHYDKDIPAIEARPDSRADCPAK